MNLTLNSCPAADSQASRSLQQVIGKLVADPEDGQFLFAVDPELFHRPDARITIATVDGHLAGAVATYRVDPGNGWLVSLGVLRPFRGRGLALALVRRAVQDRDLIDGTPFALQAQVRIRRDGSLNLGSAKALEACGFRAVGEFRVDVAAGGVRAAHLAATAEPDGTVRTLLLVRTPHSAGKEV